MKRLVMILLMGVMVLTTVLTGCSSSEGSSSTTNGSDGEEVYTIRVAYVVAETHASHIVLQDIFKKELEATGKFNVELYPNGQLGGDRQAIEAVGLGSLEMTMAGEASISGFVPEFELVGLPYIFNSLDAAHDALDGDFGKNLDELLEAQNMYNLGWGDVGFRNITNSTKEIKSPSDMKGIKIRTMETPTHLTYFSALGANPTPMAFNELFTALQQGTVDAQENPSALIYNSKFYEVQSFMTVSEHVFTAAPILISKDFMDNLPQDLQDKVSEVAEKTKKAQRELLLQQNTDFELEIANEGVKVTKLSDEEKEKFKKVAIEQVYPGVVEQYGEELIQLAQKYNE
ncbi:DctP family TRAP transporter solute-binding subunit [Alkalibaculum sp. M08DMB]|uniref:DctP family TRAP transporter solute-binding subunit n=1 Tax=Alkalibaculum sporogenes TaxID=2655001 RepID=A0A6A7K7V4_9FIRM|nr:TRAP transporter substrate-binding protein [Alkalibaculum sporogenes]MPW25568.1 DctP family TRAP transporter solute-binding subunit [Alkalibaculum sporogenes]